MSKTWTDNTTEVVTEQDIGQLLGCSPGTLDLRERKRHQNRVAQRNYREEIYFIGLARKVTYSVAQGLIKNVDCWLWKQP